MNEITATLINNYYDIVTNMCTEHQLTLPIAIHVHHMIFKYESHDI